MKKIAILILLITASCQILATNIYFDATGGSDAGAGTIGSPYQTITKMNTLFSGLSNGDSILLKAGETFYGEIVLGHAHIKFGRYGTGAKPIVTGFYTIPAWTNVSGNIWESTSAVSLLSTCNIISKNGVLYPHGRTPNTGYWTIGSTGGNNITDATNLNSSVTNWTGSQVVMRKYRWIMDKYTISSASGSTINFTSSGDTVRAGWGYFIMNDQRCLDQANEWSYNSSSKKVSIYSVGSPSGTIKVSALSTAVNVNGYSNCSFSNIVFTGFNTYGINAPADDNLTVTGCDFSFIGNTAIYQYFSGGDASNCLISGNTFTDIGSMAVHAGSSSNSTITGNTILRIGRYPGMGGNGDVSYCGIVNVGNTHEISNNTIRATGYCGIRWDGNAALIQKNFVDSFCFSKDDGGGIYVYPNATGPSDTVSYTTRTVRDNIVINGIGALAGGEPSSNYGEVMCFYNDGTSPDVIYRHNTAASSYYGAFFNSGQRITIDSNLIYDCRRNIHAVKYSGYPIEDWTIRHNTSVAKENNQYALYLEPGTNQIPASWDLDYNCYARPLSDNQTIWYDPGGSNVYVTLAQWKAAAFASGEDQNSTKGFKEVSTTNDLLFIYNETGSTVTKPLPAKYANVNGGATYVGQITLAPYSSAVLIKTGAIVMPNLINWKRSVAGGKEFRWQSAEEDNLAYYSVEESADAGKTWRVIGKKMAVGPSTYILRP